MTMKILIKGAGDIATGIASRLYRGGHQLMMTEIAVPLTVRRTVAFSRAVYEGSARVEDMEAYLAADQGEAEEIMARGDIAVMVDEKAESRKWFCPDVIVDAVLAKRNLGTKISDAPFVIGVGPGFTAGEDCNCVVETKRGHTLGNVIWKGSAIPNTGVPGNVGGYTTERLLRASADGVIEPKVQIGECVEKGQIAALTGGNPVYAQMSGIVRGMLQPGVPVQEGLKIGDIDARAEQMHCYTISDKAKAVGGGVLEAVSGFEKMKGRYAVILLAAGQSLRFGSDKLSALIDGKEMYRHVLDKFHAFAGFPVFLVTGSEKIAQAGREAGMTVVQNERPQDGITRSLILGLKAVMEKEPDIQGALFSVCDQPGIEVSTIQHIFNTAARYPGSITCAGHGDRTGNPVLWDRCFFQELLQLEGDKGGRQIMGRHKDKVRIIQAEKRELKDIDRREDLP